MHHRARTEVNWIFEQHGREADGVNGRWFCVSDLQGPYEAALIKDPFESLQGSKMGSEANLFGFNESYWNFNVSERVTWDIFSFIDLSIREI